MRREKLHIYCDSCGKEVVCDELGGGRKGYKEPADWQQVMFRGTAVDLCPECAKKLDGLMDNVHTQMGFGVWIGKGE